MLTCFQHGQPDSFNHLALFSALSKGQELLGVLDIYFVVTGKIIGLDGKLKSECTQLFLK